MDVDVAAEIARLEGMSLPKLAAEVMDRAFGPQGPGAPGVAGTIEAPSLSAERVRVAEVARVVTPAFVAADDATDQMRVGNLVAEALQALELAALVRVAWRGGTEDYLATRRGRQAAQGSQVEALVSRALG